MTIAEMKEQRLRVVKQASDLVKTDMNAETRAKVLEIYAEADAIKSNIELAEQAEKLEQELRSSQPLPPSPINGAAEFATENKAVKQGSAFNKFLRFGVERLNAEERGLVSELRDLSVTSGAAGAYTIAQGFSDKLEQALKFYGGMRQAATSFDTSTGAVYPWPTDNDTQNAGSLMGAQTVPGTADAQDIAFGVVNFGSYTYTTKYINVPNELLQDSAFDLEGHIAKKFVERIGRVQNTHFTVGTGTGQPTGLLTATTTGLTAIAGNVAAITYNNLVNLIHSVDIAYRPGAKFMFHDTTLGALRQLTDSYGRPLLGMGINGGDPDAILGYGYIVNNDMPVLAASAKSLLFGDYSKYMIRDVKGLAIMRLTELRALQNQTAFVGFARCDGNLLDAGTHPTKWYQNSAT